ncbi:MAG TPA: alanine--tRNA ligase [Paludibacteraceae bacterium]|nr:alanine--tRNA ligase [Paludibacteraceae bacterium]HRS67518.1 alanine--tRNA ligase [Paludibacteraceae bacterium]
MMTSKEIRQSFLDFFASKGHHIVPSAPMVIKDDPTLMFTNAGMNQFKNIILGNDPIVYPRVANSQKCLRVSGKHNDLEEVGHDTYHHTMFEMLGNWSFGDYFKAEAIAWAWEYLTEVLKLDKERLYVTVFEGAPNEGLTRDEEAATIWEKYIAKDRIINGNKKDNFWEMGDTGPCGPCSEIHIDLRADAERAKIDGKTLVNGDHPEVIEIWNNVFMQYNRKADGSLETLPKKVIDTGMGFERLCVAVQGKKSNYDTDVFQPLLQSIGEICNCKYGVDKKTDIAMRVVADHIRTVAFAITDGQLPSNAKAGYVIRRILRRAVRYGYTFMNQRSAFMYKLIPALIENMGQAYPELKAQQALIEKVIKEEEESFLRTLETGIRLLDKVMGETKKANRSEISGVEAFTLYDTYGFPLDLTELILKEHGLTLNVSDFKAEMEKQKNRARNAAAVETGDWIVVAEGDSTFVGYDQLTCETHILRYRKMAQKGKNYYQVVLNKTPFYAEMGGQVGDTGTLRSANEVIEIQDTKRENNLPVHIVAQLPQNLSATFTATVDKKRRAAIEANHSATHLLHEALRELLGNHVEQKGSYVSAESLRFDFSHFQKVTPEELRTVEHMVNKRIRENISLNEHRTIPIAEAQKMGAMALFGEKYGDQVRVIQYDSSVELCGGTHVKATGEIGLLRIVSESSIAAGIRRIEAVTGENAEFLIDGLQDAQRTIQELFHNTPDIISAAKKLLEENAVWKKKVDEFMQERAQQLRDTLLQLAQDINGVKIIRHKGNETPDLFKTITPYFKDKFIDTKFMFVAGTVNEGKPTLTVFLSQPMVNAGFHAGNMVREAAKLIEGGGGGQPFMASAGGKNPAGIDKAIDQVIDMIK